MDPELKKEIIDDLDRFVSRRDYYTRVGKAWKRGHLLYGPPGTGKSSLVAAIANYLNFDAHDLELTNVHSNSQLRSVLLGTKNRSILLIKDIDCSAELRDRNDQYGRPKSRNTTLTLSGLLNVIDGIWSCCGDERIIVFTTNHKDKLDPSLLRPGRMNKHIHMSYITPQGFRILASNYLSIDNHHLFGEIEELMLESQTTPAEVAEQLMVSDDVVVSLNGLVQFLKRKILEAKQFKEEEAQKTLKVKEENVTYSMMFSLWRVVNNDEAQTLLGKMHENVTGEECFALPFEYFRMLYDRGKRFELRRSANDDDACFSQLLKRADILATKLSFLQVLNIRNTTLTSSYSFLYVIMHIHASVHHLLKPGDSSAVYTLLQHRHYLPFDVAVSYYKLLRGCDGEHGLGNVSLNFWRETCYCLWLQGCDVDTYYTHAKWSKPRILNKLKGVVVNTVAWNRQQITEASTREIILGTDDGQLYEMAVDEKDKKEKYINNLYELSELPEAFMGLQMEVSSLANATRYYVMAVTPTRLYSFTGIGALDTVFASYSDRAVHFMELPGDIPNSELYFFIKQRRAVHFAWLSGAGIYHGDLNFGAQHSSSNGDENFVENKALLSYSKLSDGGEAVKPRSLAVSEFHYLLLIGDKVKVVNRISENIIEELQFDHASESASRAIIGLCGDATAGLFYAYDQNSIFQVSVQDEGRDMWQVYLDMKAYAIALANCRDPFQRDQVYLVQAEAAFSTKDFFRAASFYSKINYLLSFEEITLKFISINEQDALRTFLLRKLDNLSKDDKCQITMISTWATELYLDKINRLLLEDDTASNNHSPEYYSIIQEFRAFLSDSKDVLDEVTTMTLLESYGRVDELVYFANLKEHYEIVVHHYIQQGEAKKALEVLQKPAVNVELQYKFAPDLIMLDAYETVESWMITSNLNPRRLIPAMMRYSSEPHAKNETHEVIKYLEYCVHRLLNEDTGVHNLLLSLYATQEDDSALLRFLQCKFGKGRANGPEFFYDPKYALRLCLKEKRMRACVHIYSMMSMHEEAVALALQVDPELAMAEADKVEDDEDLRKKLWLMVAKHVIEQEKGTKRENIRKAIAFLKETDGLLKIEDILPFFPDFALIDDFKEAICSSLEDYNKQIEQLKQEMNEATHGADNIRNDITALAQRYAVIESDEGCGVCRRKILTVGGLERVARGYTSVGLMAPFYVFPCGHSFHAQCLIAHVTQCSNRAQAEYILDLQKQLSLLSVDSTKDSNGLDTEEETLTSMTPEDKLRSQLDDAIASECPFCGDLMIREISLPFILPDEANVSSWDIKPPQLSGQKSLSLGI